MNELLPYMDGLYKAAIIKTRDADSAEDLVQETYLHTLLALRNGRVIENPKAYLYSVLNNRFFLRLRKKYAFSTVSYDEFPQEIPCGEEAFDNILRTEEAAQVRRQLAFLARTYREVMVRYYMKGESVDQIAGALSIPRGTVLSRLDTGRKKVRKGVVTMEAYQPNSYQPETLCLSINGRIGRDKEPFSCIKNSLDQNILIVAYEKPLTVSEISQALGVPMAFIEENVDSLVRSELMKRVGNRVATDFFIASGEDIDRNLEIAKAFAKETFDQANRVYLSMAEAYREIKGFAPLNDTQRYLLAVLSSRQRFAPALSEAIGGPTLKYEDYPDRPNYGKWIAGGTRYPHGYDFEGESARYGISGRCGVDELNETLDHAIEWDTPVGHTHHAVFPYSLDERERALAIDAVRTETVDPFQAELLPALEKLGFIRTEGNRKVPAVPYITKDEEKRFGQIEQQGGDAFCAALLDRAAAVCRKHIVPLPAHVTYPADWMRTGALNDLPMVYVYEAAERGIITLEEGKNYPVMYLVWK